jgi:outer membrane protein assembly factor BamB
MKLKSSIFAVVAFLLGLYVARHLVAGPAAAEPGQQEKVVASAAESAVIETSVADRSIAEKGVAVKTTANSKGSPETAADKPVVSPSSAARGVVKTVAYDAPVAKGAAGRAKSGSDGITREWNQWGGSSMRNNTPVGKNIPIDFDSGEFDSKTREWKKDTAKNIKWVANLGSQSYGNPVISGGKVFVGTNNGAGWLKRYPASVDLGCLLCFNLADGKFLWQHSSEKLPTGRVHDWPLQGICSTPYVEGDRLWFVTSRGQIACLDTEGFLDGENDGPFKSEKSQDKDEADVVWYLDMMGQLGVSQHNMCSCSITATGDILWVCTSNGVDESHNNLPAPQAPSFLAVDKKTGKVIWSDASPGLNILHGQWSSPAYAVLGGVPQVMFAGGDAYLYSFLGEATNDGKAKLLWKFDANPKESKYILGGRGTRNEIIGTPVVHNGLVYLGVGQDPEHGEGIGHLWCIDPTKRGDVSTELAFNLKDLKTPIPHKRLQAVVPEDGEVARPNPNSAMVWHYSEYDQNGDNKIDFTETMHRTCGTVAIKNDLLFIADFSGLFHCLDARTGKPYWTHDLFAACWSSPLIVEDKVYIGDEEGKVTVFRLSPKKEVLAENHMDSSVYSTPVVANNVLYISDKTHLFAISADNAKQHGAK